MDNNNLIAFLGCIGAGKDFNAKKLIEKGYVQINFADDLRDMCWEILRWKPANEQEYEAFKTRYLSGLYEDSIEINEEGEEETFGYAEEPFGLKLTGRQVLQHLGASLRDRDPEFWVKCWTNKVKKALSENKKVVCSDARHVNEIQAVMDLGGTAKFCNYLSSRYSNTDPHISEALAQGLLKIGFVDGDIISQQVISSFDQ